MPTPKPLLTAVVTTPETGTAGTFIVMDLLSAVGTFWQTLHREAPGIPRFEPRLVTFDGEPYRDLHGVQITPHGSFEDFPKPDIVIIPELAIDPWKPLPNSFVPVSDWLRSTYEDGAIVASLCSGSVLLSETGLLDGEEATSHWAYCDAIKSRHPSIKMRRERVLVMAGDGHRLITTGGFSSWHDLVGRVAGPEEARRLSKLFLLDWHLDGQLPFAALTVGRNHEDPLVAAAQTWAADNYANPNPVSAMASASGLTERSFLRRFKKATGQTPLEYVQTLRIEEAKQMLETTSDPFNEIAAEVGYSEPSAFRHLFRKLVGITPSAYRTKHQRVFVEQRSD
jgi:transcriptional regulator GlxA family with amidase domain